MSPELPDPIKYDEPVVLKYGGSLLFAPDSLLLDQNNLSRLLDILRLLSETDRKIVAVIGGGNLARARIDDARRAGVVDPKDLDEIGIGITHSNARIVNAAARAHGLCSSLPVDKRPNNQQIAVCGGTAPGHTTDYVAVESAIYYGADTVFIISNVPGLYPLGSDPKTAETILESINLREYIAWAKTHEPGQRIPIDRKAAILAEANTITLVLLGNDMNNFSDCLEGKLFVGTILCPAS